MLKVQVAELIQYYLLVGQNRGHRRPMGTDQIYIPSNVLTDSSIFILLGPQKGQDLCEISNRSCVMTVARRTVKTADYDRFVHQQPDNNTFFEA